MLQARPQAPLSLSLVVPVFNEEATVFLFLDRIQQTFRDVSGINLECVFINDGSSDNTLEYLLSVQQSNPSIRIVDLSRNFGI